MFSARRLSAVLIAAAALGAAPPAHADGSAPPAVRFGPGTQAEAVARQMARDAWGGEPCGGQVSVTWGQLEASVNARSTWMNPTDPYANPSQNYDCNVEFNTGAEFDWLKYCTVMVHEYGHLVGQQHSDEKSSVMYPEYEDTWPACESTADPTSASDPSPAPEAEADLVSEPANAVAGPATRKSLARSRTSVRHRARGRRRASARRASTRRASSRGRVAAKRR